MIAFIYLIIVFALIMGYVILNKFDEFGDFKDIYIGFALFLCLCSGLLYCNYRAKGYSCERKATAQGLEYRYGFWEGCLVKESDGNYIDYDRYRVMK